MSVKACESKACKTYHQYAYSFNCSLDISCGTDKENLFSNQELLQLVLLCLFVIQS